MDVKEDVTLYITERQRRRAQNITFANFLDLTQLLHARH